MILKKEIRELLKELYKRDLRHKVGITDKGERIIVHGQDKRSIVYINEQYKIFNNNSQIFESEKTFKTAKEAANYIYIFENIKVFKTDT